MSLPYELAGQKAQESVIASIPAKYILPSSIKANTGTNVIDIPRTCGILTEKQLEITEQIATTLLRKISTKSLSSVEVTEAFLARAAIAHQLTNCLTAYFPSEALETAKKLDDHIEKTGKPIGPLHGLPVSIKDIYSLKGHISTMGYISWASQTATTDANLISVLRSAGAVFYVKTTMPQTGMALETTSHLWGTTLNPYNINLAAGGSSGGDAVLIAMKGAPIAPGSDIGGSIRVPAAFNGLYSIRPSSERISRVGIKASVTGQLSIKVSCGPLARSVDDLKEFTKVLIKAWSEPLERVAVDVVPVPWIDDVRGKREMWRFGDGFGGKESWEGPGKLRIGIWDFDGVCMPHPPILRALRETAEKLKKAGHEVIPIKMPFDCWEVALTTWKLYFQTGAAEIKSALATTPEPMIPSLTYLLELFNIKPLTITELFALNTSMSTYKSQMSTYWNSLTSTTHSLDTIICPTHPSASFPHNFPCWWGYSTLWNILDYPSTTLPVRDLRIDDERGEEYVPLENGFDRETWEIYDPEVFKEQPVCIQVVCQPFLDEKLLEVTKIVDECVNDPSET